MTTIPRLNNYTKTRRMTMMLFCGDRDNNNTHAYCARFANHTVSSIPTSSAHQNHNLNMNATLRALCQAGRLKDAIHVLLTTTTTKNPTPLESSTCLRLLETCIAKKALSEGKLIHSHINHIGFAFTPFTHAFLQNKLIYMYVNCGSLVDAWKVFDCMTERDVFSWNSIISAYQRHGFPGDALTLFHQMQRTAVRANQFTFPSILQACAKLGDLQQGLSIHQTIIKTGFCSDVVVASALIDLHAKCGNIWKACQVFDQMPHRNAFSWTAMIGAFAQNGLVEKALGIFKQMQLVDVKPSSATFATIVSTCAKMGSLQQGMNIHQRIIDSGFSADIVVASALVDMYAKCGSIHKAQELFDKMPHRNTVSWTAMIAGYAQNGFLEKALETFKQMQFAGVKPSSATLASILPACAKMGALEEGLDIHQKAIESGFSSDIVVVSALIDMYAKCGRIHKAQELFDKMPYRNTVSWTAMIAGYAQNGFFEKAMETFKQMQLAGVKPSSTTFSSILSACAKMGTLEQGIDIHQGVIESGFSLNIVVASSLIDMYAKCGSTHKAQELFDKMPHRNTVSWTVMISGFALNGLLEKALEIFKQMQLAGIKPSSAIFASILPACARMGALEQGMDIHRRIIESGFLSDIVVASALIDMYAKCGSIQKARELFDKMPHRNTVSWNAMIAGYAMHGYGKDALKLFELMKHLQTDPSEVSFVCVLFACSHAGLVDEGCKYFNSMSDSYCIMPTMDHYMCIVDLLGRAGYLEEALNFIVKMPIKPNMDVWTCLLGTCRSHKNIELGEFVATLIFVLDTQNSASYIFLSNIYAELGRWVDVQKVRKLMKDRGIKKTSGCSWIEVYKRVHVFL